MVAAKMDKKELEEKDAFFETFDKIMIYARENRQKLYVGAGVLALVIVLAGGWLFYSSQNEREASKKYFDARLAVMKSDPTGTGRPAPESLKGVRDIIDQYPSTEAAQSARYELGGMLFTAGQFDDAIQVYKDFLDKASKKDIRAVFAWVGIGYAYEGKKEYDKALESFQKVLDLNAGNISEGIGYRNMARIYEEKNDREKAVDFYKKALDKTKDPGATMLIKRKIAMLS